MSYNVVMNKKETKPTECCPPFDPKLWQEKKLVWKNKRFVKDSVVAFMHIPLNMEQVMKRMWIKIQAADAAWTEEWLMLTDDPTPWKSDQYIAVNKEVPKIDNVKISGTFLTRVFEGPYKEARNWHEEMMAYAKKKTKKAPIKIYFYYTTCPKCAKERGKNYVVGLAQVA